MTGECILAIAMTEPNTGSDLAAIRTTAIADGDHWILSGTKTFITNGQICDAVLVAAKTNPAESHSGMSLLMVDAGTPGFTKGRVLNKIGMHAQDTSELHFEDCRIPKGQLRASSWGKKAPVFTTLWRSSSRSASWSWWARSPRQSPPSPG